MAVKVRDGVGDGYSGNVNLAVQVGVRPGQARPLLSILLVGRFIYDKKGRKKVRKQR